jgi:polysaccharide chain length determinant protein (PEP-CTERM system associated)
MTSRPNDRPESGVGYDFALAVWQRRKWLAMLTFVAVFAGAVSLALSLPNVYRATATAIVERQVSETLVRPSVTTELETRIQTIHKQVTSRARLSEVIQRFGLYPELKGLVPLEGIVERMRRDIEFGLSGVEQQMTGRMATISFSVSYSGRDRETVAEVANALVASYVDENTRRRERQAFQTAEVLKQQLDETKRELDAQEQREREFTLRHTSELPQQIEVNLSALDRLNTQLRLNGEYQIKAIERGERLEQELAAAESGTATTAPTTPTAQLTRLKHQLAELRTKFSDEYPDVVRIKLEIARLSEEAGTGTVGTNGHAPASSEDPARRLTERSLERAQAELKALKGEEVMLRRLIADYEGRVQNAPKRQDELQQLSRDRETNKERYQTLLKHYEEARLAESLEQGQKVEQLRVLDPAIPTSRPWAPNRFWLLLMGLIAAVALAFAAVVAAERLDTSFHTVDDLRAFVAVPTLAVIRRLPTRANARAGWLRPALVMLAFLVGLAFIIAGTHYVGSGNEQIARMTARAR